MLLWTKHAEGWKAHDVGAGVFLARDTQAGHQIVSEYGEETLAAIVPFVSERSPGAALIPAHGTRASVDGFPALSFHALHDRAEISIAGVLVVFGAYSVPELRRYRGDERETCCSRCKLTLRAGDPVTECPACHAILHVSEERFAAWLATHDAGIRDAAKTAVASGGDGVRVAEPNVQTAVARDAASMTDGEGTHDDAVDCDLISDRCAGCDKLRSQLLWTPDDEHGEVRDA